MLSKHKQKELKNKLPRKRDIGDWGENKCYQFLTFVDFFFDYKENKFVTTQERIDEAWEQAPDQPFWDEFLIRIGNENFQQRFITSIRAVCSWLKDNPHGVNNEIYELLEKNPRTRWASSAFTTQETEHGTVVVLNNQETTDPSRTNAAPAVSNVKSPEEKYHQALFQSVTVLNKLLEGINQSEIKKMGTQKRLDMANKMLNTLSKQFSQGETKNQVNVFTQISKNSGKEDLESAIYEYQEGQN